MHSDWETFSCDLEQPIIVLYFSIAEDWAYYGSSKSYLLTF